jgi:hypothetical protein
VLSVELINQLLRIPEILRRLPASPYVTVTSPLYEIMELPVASLGVEDSVDFPFVGVVNDRRLRSRWQLAGGRRCIAVEQRDVENIVLPDRIRKVKFVSILIDDLTYCVRSCPFVIQLL